MPHDDLQRLALRLGVVHSMAAQAKETAGKLSAGADEYERALLKRTNVLARQIRREGVGKNPQAEHEYCQLLMQRRRMLQSYELAKRDGERMPDVKPTSGLRKALASVPFQAAPTIYLICATEDERAARELAVSLSSAGIEALACADTPEAVTTATMLHEVLGASLAASQSGFRPWDRGLYHGQAGEVLQPFIVDHRDEPVPGGESFDTYHARFMTSLTPLLILVGRGIRHTLGVVTHRENLILASAWLNSGGKLGDLFDLDLAEFSTRIVPPGTVLRMSFTPEGWEGQMLSPLQKGRAGRKAQPGQLGMDFDEEAHPREGAGQHDARYKPGEFVPKEHGGGEKLTLHRQGNPVGRSGAGTFYTFDPARLKNSKPYEKEFHNIHDVPAAMHEPFAGNPSEALRRQWLPHLDPHEVWLEHGKELGHKSAVDTGDWLVANAAHDRGHDGIRYEGLEMQSLLDGFAPHERFTALNSRATADPRQEWQEKGVRSQAFKAWFGDWENNPKMASKVVDQDGKPQENYEVEASQVIDEDGQARAVYHGTAKGGWREFSTEHLDPRSLYGPGFYFTEDKTVADSYQEKGATWKLDRDLTHRDMGTVSRFFYSKAVQAEIREDIGLRLSWKIAAITHEEGREVFQTWLQDSDSPAALKIVKKIGIGRTPVGNPETFSVYLNIRRPVDMDKPLTGEAQDTLRTVLYGLGVPEERMPGIGKHLDGHTAFDFYKDIYHELPSLRTSYQSPEDFASQVFKAAGFDGITHIGGDRKGGGHHHRVWIAFKPEQIKGTENEGTFDPTSPDIRKGLDSGPFVPPDMPRWQKRPEGGQRYLPLNAVEDREKLREMIQTMRAGRWTWDKPIVNSGDQLLTGSHRYHAAKETGETIPLKDFGEVCAEGGIDFEKEWRARAEPYGGWISNVSNVIRLFPPGLAEKYGIELG